MNLASITSEHEIGNPIIGNKPLSRCVGLSSLTLQTPKGGFNLTMGTKLDLVGDRFGRLVVTGDTGRRYAGNVIWSCRCDCGNEVDIRGASIRSGLTKSCGCLQRETSSENGKNIPCHVRVKNIKKAIISNTTHGGCRRSISRKLYWVWHKMKRRCQNPSESSFKYYGGKGVGVCEDWESYPSFRDWANSAGYVEGLCIHRMDNDSGYSPSNCTWMGRSEHASLHGRKQA